MGDWYQSFVAPDIQLSEVESARSKAVQILLERRIIQEEMSDCVFSSLLAYPPGENAESILIDGKNAGFAHTKELLTNGVEIITTRKLHMDASSEPECACPNCSSRQPPEFFFENCVAAMWQWQVGEEAEFVGCPECSVQSVATAWRTDPERFVCSNFAITFWNWPPIDEKFSTELEDLFGSRVVALMAKF